jgi:hypothetical protein
MARKHPIKGIYRGARRRMKARGWCPTGECCGITHAPASTLALAGRAEVMRTASWRVAESLKVLLQQVNAMAPGRDKRSDGTIGDAAHASRNSDHNPWVRDGALGVVTAMDITHDPARGCDCNAIAAALEAGRDARIKYVIWNRRIMSSVQTPWRWRTYSGPNPHSAHIHVSVLPEKGLYDAQDEWLLNPA